MKQVIIIRHAKSDQRFWGNDFERPLNERGKADAPVMARRLKDQQIGIDAWISSPAERAKRTAEIFTKEFGLSADEVIFISALYHAAPEVFYDVLGHLPDNLATVSVFSHNPGITYFVNSLVDDVSIDNMPTCGVFAVSAAVSRWQDFARAKKKFLFFDYPKLGS
ncbi:MAG TPA: histidine phosphatase family protein [Ferruginibacter sp.]|nr:histidine phosphatase family protein [Ferruginibacter sp.]